MKKTTPKKLSSGEMELMSMLWEHGSLALSEAHEKLGRPIGYTTMQTRLNRLVDKGLARRSKERPARYEAVISPDDVSANHLDDLLHRVTRGKVVPLVAHLVDDRSISRDELRELKKIIRDAEQRLADQEDAS
jgi:BlaI family penicillinase repressor